MQNSYTYILEQLKNFKCKRFSLKSFNHNQILLKIIIESTSFLDHDASISERLYCIKNNIIERKMCPVCKVNPLKFAINLQKYYETGCCPSCSKLNKDVQEKTQQTNLKIYGVKSHNSAQCIKDKKVKSYLDHYGVINPSQVQEIKDKKKKTSLINNGVECVLKLDLVRKSRQITSLIDSYNNVILTNEYDSPLFTLDEYSNRKNETELLKFKCKKCGYIFETWHHDGIHSRCPKCFKNGKSFGEYELCSFLNSLNINYIRHERNLLKPQELDIYIPENKLAIEFDGLYWHSFENNKNYHLNKTELCEKYGIQLIHIFENEWNTKQEIVKARIKNILGIYEHVVFARKCVIKEIDSKSSREFQEANHIQGSVNAKVNLGLYFNNELISLMTFGKCRFDKKHEWEMLRFCNKLGYHIPGGAGKLLKYFERNYNPKSLVSYADRRWSQGKVYEALNFKLNHISEPNYWYWKKIDIIYSRNACQKHKLKNILEIFDEHKSEYENMKNNGYNRIYDCGNLVFEKYF